MSIAVGCARSTCLIKAYLKKKKPPCLSHVFNFDLDSCLCLNFIFLTSSYYHEEEGMPEAP